MQHDTSSDAQTSGNGAMPAKLTGRSAKQRAHTEARQKKVAALFKEGKSVQEIARKLKVNDGTIYNDKRVLEGLPAYGSKRKKGTHPQMAKAAQGRVSMQVYTMAKKLRDATRKHVIATGGDVDDLAMYATLLTRELLGE